jgi:hypothetical protein
MQTAMSVTSSVENANLSYYYFSILGISLCIHMNTRLKQRYSVRGKGCTTYLHPFFSTGKSIHMNTRLNSLISTTRQLVENWSGPPPDSYGRAPPGTKVAVVFQSRWCPDPNSHPSTGPFVSAASTTLPIRRAKPIHRCRHS